MHNYVGQLAEIHNASAIIDMNPMQCIGEHLGEVSGESHPHEMQQIQFKRKVAELAITADSAKKRPRSNYEWRGDAVIASILGKNTKLASKFQHLSYCRPPD